MRFASRINNMQIDFQKMHRNKNNNEQFFLNMKLNDTNVVTKLSRINWFKIVSDAFFVD